MTWIPDAALDRLRDAFRCPEVLAGRYELRDSLGEGGMGHVYLAHDRELDRPVAVKVLRETLADAGAAERMAREARIIARLEHPGIVPVHDVGRLPDGRFFYVMKCVRGVRLDAYFHAKSPLADRLRVFARICETVAFAHAHGVIHRDLKPQNVMVGEFGEVLVLDWGVAKFVGSGANRTGEDAGEASAGFRRTSADAAAGESTTTTVGTNSKSDSNSDATAPSTGHRAVAHVGRFVASEAASVSRSSSSSASEDPDRTRTAATMHGTVLGTPAYMSPEQARGEIESVDERSDVFALGAILFFLLTGRAPRSATLPPEFGGENAPSESARVVNRAVPKPMNSLCGRAMALAASDRYPSARSLADDVLRFLNDERVLAHREGWIEKGLRIASANRTFIALVLAYLVMRALMIVWARI